MQLDWSTFFLQTVNFLILVWILRRFLYRPVLEVVARRRAGIEDSLAQAAAAGAKAAALRKDYEERVAQWEAEREAARAKLKDELDGERARMLALAQKALAADRERSQALEAGRRDELRRAMETEALALGASFAARLLQRLAGATLDDRLVDILIEDLGTMSDTERQKISEASRGADVVLTCARPPGDALLDRLRHALEPLTGGAPPPQVRVDPSLISGVRVQVGPWVLAASLADELAFFRAGATRAD